MGRKESVEGSVRLKTLFRGRRFEVYYTGSYTWMPRLFNCDLRRVLFSSLPFLELHYCTGAYRISPTDVNSRPSSCLTNFLLNGKQGKLPVFYLHIVHLVDPQTKYPFSATHLGGPQGARCCWSSPGSRGQRSSATCSAATGARSSCTCSTATAPPWRTRPPSARAAEAEWQTTASLYAQCTHAPTHPCCSMQESSLNTKIYILNQF